MLFLVTQNFIYFLKIFIYSFIHSFIHSFMAVLGISCSMQDLLVAACQLLVAACMWDLVPPPGIKSGPPALGARRLTHRTTREVPKNLKIRMREGKNAIQRKTNEPNCISNEYHNHRGERGRKREIHFSGL